MTRHRKLAHSYRDELPPSRPTVEPIVTSWTEALVIIAQAVIIGAVVYVLLVLVLALAQ